MRTMTKRLIIFLFLLLFQHTLFAEGHDAFFVQHYDNRNGLSNSSINYIFKDAGNLLWVATWDGLNMYDGNNFHRHSIGASYQVLRKNLSGPHTKHEAYQFTKIICFIHFPSIGK